MTDEQWDYIDNMLATWWGQPWSVQQSEGYRLALDRFDATDVAKAVTRKMDEGGEFRPAAGEIRKLLTGGTIAQRPASDEAVALIQAAIRKVGASIYARDFDQRHQAAIDWLAEQDEVLAAFAARRGLIGTGTLNEERFDDPDVGGMVRGRIGKEYGEAVKAARERESRGLPAVDRAMLVVRGTGVTNDGMKELVERLRPAAELEAGDGE